MQHYSPSKVYQALLPSDDLTLSAHAASLRRLTLRNLASRKSLKQWPCRIWPRKGVVIAAGAWTPHLARMIGSAQAPGLADSGIQPRKGHLLELPASLAPAIKHGLMEIGYAKVCRAALKHCITIARSHSWQSYDCTVLIEYSVCRVAGSMDSGLASFLSWESADQPHRWCLLWKGSQALSWAYQHGQLMPECIAAHHAVSSL